MIAASLTLWGKLTTLWGTLTESLCEFGSRQSLVVTAVISFLSPPALALMIYGGYSLLGSGSTDSASMRDGGGREATRADRAMASGTMAGGAMADHTRADGTVAGGAMTGGAMAVTVAWAISTNAETKGDRIVLSAAEMVRQRFVFDLPPPEVVPLPRPRPEELIALDAPPVDLLPALGRDKREECKWDRLTALPDVMRSCVGPPLQLTPPQR